MQVSPFLFYVNFTNKFKPTQMCICRFNRLETILEIPGEAPKNNLSLDETIICFAGNLLFA